MVLVLTVVVLQFISFANYALTTKTTNIIYGSAPYLTFDGGRTRITNTEALLGISLSDGRTFTPTTNNSSLDNPIELPVVGQSFADIGMLVPTDTNSIALSSLIGPPNNYWGDDDGDGQGIDGITATGSLKLSIVDKDDNPVARNKVLTSCNDNGPYKLTLSNSEGILTTRYGVPNESRFSAGNATYYIKPKVASICFAQPFHHMSVSGGLSDAVWKNVYGFLPQSFTPSSYGLNFPTTGAHNLFFHLVFARVNQALSWAPVSHGGITATMYENGTNEETGLQYVLVILTGPVATKSQQQSENPGRIDRISLPQVFELVGRDSRGNAVVKYGFVLKQWFVGRGNLGYSYTYSSMESWCNKIGGYRVPKVRDLTNASCRQSNTGACENYANEINALTATPSSPENRARYHIGTGLLPEWGSVGHYNAELYGGDRYWTSDKSPNVGFFVVDTFTGSVTSSNSEAYAVCVYP